MNQKQRNEAISVKKTTYSLDDSIKESHQFVGTNLDRSKSLRKKAIIFARKSSDPNDPSINQQIEQAYEFCGRCNLKLLRVFSETVSNDPVSRSIELLQALIFCLVKRPEFMIVTSYESLSQSMEDSYSTIKTFARQGTKVITTDFSHEGYAATEKTYAINKLLERSQVFDFENAEKKIGEGKAW